MIDDDIVALKEEVDCLRMKCEELTTGICREMDKNKKLIAKLENSEDVISQLNERIKYLEGQVDAYQYCVSRGKR